MKQVAVFLAGLDFGHENGGNTLLENIGSIKIF
jgi:hypothetical protein